MGVFVYCDVMSVSRVGLVAFLFLTSGTSHIVRLYVAASKVGLLTETVLRDLTLITNNCRLFCGYREFRN